MNTTQAIQKQSTKLELNIEEFSGQPNRGGRWKMFVLRTRLRQGSMRWREIDPNRKGGSPVGILQSLTPQSLLPISEAFRGFPLLAPSLALSTKLSSYYYTLHNTLPFIFVLILSYLFFCLRILQLHFLNFKIFVSNLF